MDLSARKYHFIEELMAVEEESVMDALEQVLKLGKEAKESISNSNKNELDKRLKTYSENPENILNWQDVKNQW